MVAPSDYSSCNRNQGNLHASVRHSGTDVARLWSTQVVNAKISSTVYLFFFCHEVEHVEELNVSRDIF